MAFPEKNTEVPVPDNIDLREAAHHDESMLNALCLKDKSILDDAVRTGIKHGMFWDKKQKEMFGLMAKYWVNHQSVLTRNAFESLVEQNQNLSEELKVSFKMVYDDLYCIDVKPDDYGFLREALEGRDMQRQAIAVLRQCESLYSAKSGVKKQVEALQQKISAIQGINSDIFVKTKSWAEALIEDVWPEIQQRQVDPLAFRGIMSGFSQVDLDFNGFLPGKYMVISGRPNGGKTTVMLNMAINMVRNGKTVIFITIEDEYKKTSMRGLTIETEINYNRIMRGGKDSDFGLPDLILNKLKSGVDTISKPGGIGERLFWIELLPETKFGVVQSEINKILSFRNVDAVFLDYLDVVGSEVSRPNRPDLELADTSSRFQSLGKRNRFLAATAQQLRSEKVRDLQKKGMAGDNFKVGVADVGGTVKISYGADYIFGLWMDEDTQDRMYLYTAKSRHSKALNRYALRIDPNSGKIDDAPTDFESLDKYIHENKTTVAEHVKEAENDIIVPISVETALLKLVDDPVTDVWPFVSDGAE